MKVKIQIKSVFGKLLFEFEKENNTIKDTLLEAIKQGADLYGADLGGANLGGADLGGANLGGADLGGADLRSANLRGANLYGADLRGADLRGADLYGADLGGADLGGADLGGADLGGADLGFIPINCPSDGAFVGWKKVQDKLIKLLIPEDAKRCSATTYKCRCDKAQVLAITSLDEKSSFDSVTNVAYNPNIEYKVGEMVYPDKFDEDRWNECSNGIHFFINKQDAINY